MPCDTRLRKGQTLSQRKEEVKAAVDRIDRLLLKKKARVVVGPQGAIAFQGLSEEDRSGVTDGCIYRRIMVTGSVLAKAEIARAELIAGRSINRQVIGQGVHSHNGGDTWHGKG